MSLLSDSLLIGSGTGPTNLITNGDFDTATGWTLGSGWTISGGKLRAAPGSGSNANFPTAMTPGQTYRVTYTISEYAAGLVVALTGSGSGGGPARTANGTYTEDLPCVGDGLFLFYKDASFNGAIDIVSVSAP